MDVRRGTVDGMWAVHLTRSRSAEPLTTTVGLRMPLDFRCAVNPRPFCLAVAAGRPAFFFFSLSPPFCACSPAHLPSRCHLFSFLNSSSRGYRLLFSAGPEWAATGIK